jgi:GxxExxY protein
MQGKGKQATRKDPPKLEARSGRSEPESAVDELAHAVIGAAIEVHRTLGPGYVEAVYEEALSVEMRLRGIPFVRQHPMRVMYKGNNVGEGRLDFLVGGVLVVELKAAEGLTPLHKARVISYLKATGNQLGLLINFNVALLREGIQRVVLS